MAEEQTSRSFNTRLAPGAAHGRSSANQRRTLVGFALTEQDTHPVDDDVGLDATGNSYSSASAEVKSFTEVANDMKRKTLMAPKELENLQRQNPGLAAWLQSGSGLFMQVVLFGVFVGIDAGKALFASKALKGTTVISTSIVISSSAISILIGLAVAAGADGAAGIRMALDFKAVRKFSIIAVFFAVAQCFQTLSYTILSPGMIKIFGQLRLPQTAILSIFFLGRRYIGAQWGVMSIVVLGAFIFMQAGVEDDEAFNLGKIIDAYAFNRTTCHNHLVEPNSCATWHSRLYQNAPIPEYCNDRVLSDPTAAQESKMLVGLMFVGIYMFLSDLGSIFSEKFLKEDAGTPFYVQKVAIELSGLPTAILMSVFLPYFQLAVGSGTEAKIRSSMWWTGQHLDPPKTGELVNNWLFQGWGSGALLALFFNCLGSWLSGLVVKKMSSVMKLLGKVVSLAIVYFLGDCWLLKVPGRDIPLNKTLAQFVVMAATYSFLNIKAPPPEKKELSELSSPNIEVLPAAETELGNVGTRQIPG